MLTVFAKFAWFLVTEFPVKFQVLTYFYTINWFFYFNTVLILHATLHEPWLYIKASGILMPAMMIVHCSIYLYSSTL